MGRPPTQHEARKKAIIEAALDCFAEHGYEGASNRLIAKAAGLNSAALIYHYFPNKESLFQACVYSVGMVDSLQDLLERDIDQNPEEYLTHAALLYLQILRDNKISKVFPMFMGSLRKHPELTPILLGRIQQAIWLPLRDYFQHQADKGVLRPISTASVLQLFLGPLIIRSISGIFIPYSALRDTDTDEMFVKELIRVFLDGARVKQK